MFRKLFFIFTLYCFLYSAEATPNTLGPANELIKGTVIHIFEDFTNQAAPQKIAKVRLDNVPNNKELALVEVPSSSILAPGDQVLLSRIDRVDDFGMGDSFENKFSLVDYARDHYILLALLPFIFLILTFNKRNLILIGIILTNLFFLFNLLPLFISWHWNLLLISPFFLAGNTYFLKLIYPSRKFIPAILSAMAASILIAGLHHLFINISKLAEYPYLQKNLSLSLPGTWSAVDSFCLMTTAFFIYFFTTLLFIKISYKKNIYNNLKEITLRLLILYLFLFVIFLLPTTIFFNINNLDNFYLFNYVPYSILLTKLIFLWWGNVLSLTIYLSGFYIQNKKYFQRHIITPSFHQSGRTVEVERIALAKKSSKYSQEKSKKTRRIKRSR